MFKKKNNQLAEFKILQNGIPIAENTFSLNKTKTVWMTADAKGDLAIPLYPLPCDSKVADIHSEGVDLYVEDDWRGVVSTHKRIIKIDKRNPNVTSYHLVPGDYASIALKDIRVMVKVGFPHSTAKKDVVKKKRTYRGSFIPHPDLSKPELISLAASAAFTAAVFAILYSGLYFKKDTRPQKFEQLDKTFILPFMHSDYFTTAPEVIQENLNRKDYINSILKYYRAFVHSLMGWNFSNAYLPKSTLKRYRKMYTNQREELSRIHELHETIITEVGSAAMPAALSFAAVRGESFQENSLRLLDKVNLMHHASIQTLQMKAGFIGDFAENEGYDWTQYKDFKAESRSQAVLEQIKANYIGKDSNEQAMYKEAGALAEQARVATQSYLNALSDNRIMEDPRVIVLPEEVMGALRALTPLDELENGKLDSFYASEYGAKPKKKIKEPLVGKIDASQVEKVIARKRFQLQLCYELALRKDRKISGKMIWKWRINTLGRPDELQLIATDITNKAMSECIARKLITWKFPKPSYGSVVVRHAFLFKKRAQNL